MGRSGLLGKLSADRNRGGLRKNVRAGWTDRAASPRVTYLCEFVVAAMRSMKASITPEAMKTRWMITIQNN